MRYNIHNVKDFDVIEFPDVNHDDVNSLDTATFLSTLSQLTIFVVDYRYVLTH